MDFSEKKGKRRNDFIKQLYYHLKSIKYDEKDEKLYITVYDKIVIFTKTFVSENPIKVITWLYHILWNESIGELIRCGLVYKYNNIEKIYYWKFRTKEYKLTVLAKKHIFSQWIFMVCSYQMRKMVAIYFEKTRCLGADPVKNLKINQTIIGHKRRIQLCFLSTYKLELFLQID